MSVGTQITATYRIAVETLKNIDDSLKQNLVLPINLWMEQITLALNLSQIGTNSNTTSKTMKQDFVSGVMIIVNNPCATAPLGVTPISGNNATHYVLSIFLTPQSDQSKIGVTVVWSDGVSGPCTFRLEGG